jgi:multicomponent Na+:H+ antiporter subunit B
VTTTVRRWVFLIGAAGLAAFYLWGLSGLPGFGRYPGPYGFIINHVAVAQTNATGVVSAVNFEYRGFDTVGEEFILFAAVAGMAVVLRLLRGEREGSTLDEAADRDLPPTSDAVRTIALLFTGPIVLIGWWLASHAQTSPSGGFQGGVVLATAFVLIYLSGEFWVSRRLSPVAVTDVVEAVGAAGFVGVGLAAVVMGLPYLKNFLPLGSAAGAVSSSGTIALISFFVGLEVAGAFVLVVNELLDQTLLIRRGGRLYADISLYRGRLDPGRRAVRHHHQPAPGASDHLPDRRPVLDVCAAARRRVRDRRRGALLLRHQPARSRRRPGGAGPGADRRSGRGGRHRAAAVLRDPGAQAVRHPGPAGTVLLAGLAWTSCSRSW